MAKSKLLMAGITALGLQNLQAVAATQPVDRSEELVFQVLLNDKDIGQHSFRVETAAGRETVDINAEFDVTFLAIPVYSYDHRNRETWRGGCLETIEAFTDDNGDESRVEGQRRDSGFELAAAGKTIELQSDCVMSFAYWDKRILSQSRLLNSQTGEYLPIEIETVGTEQLQLGNGRVDADRYNLRNRDEDIDISIWYDVESEEWLSLESRVDGRVIRYLPAEYRTAGARAEQPIYDKK